MPFWEGVADTQMPESTWVLAFHVVAKIVTICRLCVWSSEAIDENTNTVVFRSIRHTIVTVTRWINSALWHEWAVTVTRQKISALIRCKNVRYQKWCD